MGNYLHGLAQVISSSFLSNHRFINLAAGQVVKAGKFPGGKSLIMTKIQVGLGSIIQDINFPMLEGAHRAGVHIEVGIKLLDSGGQSALLQKGSESTRCKPFSQGRNHPSSYENILHVLQTINDRYCSLLATLFCSHYQ